MQDRNVVRDGESVGTTSLIALLVIAAIIGLFIWQPWSTASSVTFTTQQAHTTSIR